MSTVPEVIVNKYREINTLAFTIVSNLCFPISALEETTVESVIKTVNENAKQLKELIIRLIPEI
jgi:purine nucleoside phosphorylase